MDFTQGFHQVEVHSLFRYLTAFITFSGVYQFKRVPFGPKNAPSYSQHALVYVVLIGLLYVICEIYVDDLIVYGKDEDEFSDNLRKTFIKCKLGLTRIEYVGRVLFFDGSKNSR